MEFDDRDLSDVEAYRAWCLVLATCRIDGVRVDVVVSGSLSMVRDESGRHIDVTLLAETAGCSADVSEMKEQVAKSPVDMNDILKHLEISSLHLSSDSVSTEQSIVSFQLRM